MPTANLIHDVPANIDQLLGAGEQDVPQLTEPIVGGDTRHAHRRSIKEKLVRRRIKLNRRGLLMTQLIPEEKAKAAQIRGQHAADNAAIIQEHADAEQAVVNAMADGRTPTAKESGRLTEAQAKLASIDADLAEKLKENRNTLQALEKEVAAIDEDLRLNFQGIDDFTLSRPGYANPAFLAELYVSKQRLQFAHARAEAAQKLQQRNAGITEPALWVAQLQAEATAARAELSAAQREQAEITAKINAE